MKIARPDLAAYGIVALCLVLIATLAALGHPVSDVFQYVAVTALGIGGGVALQAPPPAAEPIPAEAAPVAAPVAAPSLAAYPPVVNTDPAATGVMRRATHAP